MLPYCFFLTFVLALFLHYLYLEEKLIKLNSLNNGTCLAPYYVHPLREEWKHGESKCCVNERVIESFPFFATLAPSAFFFVPIDDHSVLVGG